MDAPKKDGRALTSPQNGRLGGAPVGPRPATRARAEAIQRHAELTADVVIEQIARGALYDPGRLHYDSPGQECYAEDGPMVADASGAPTPQWRAGDVKRRWEIGDLKPLHEMTEADRQMIGGLEYVMKNAAAGDGVIDRILKIKLVPREKYVDMAARYHTLFVEMTDTPPVDVGQRLERARDAARARNAHVPPPPT